VPPLLIWCKWAFTYKRFPSSSVGPQPSPELQATNVLTWFNRIPLGILEGISSTIVCFSSSIFSRFPCLGIWHHIVTQFPTVQTSKSSLMFFPSHIWYTIGHQNSFTSIFKKDCKSNHFSELLLFSVKSPLHFSWSPTVTFFLPSSISSHSLFSTW
jgi:hypothetical protein